MRRGEEGKQGSRERSDKLIAHLLVSRARLDTRTNTPTCRADIPLIPGSLSDKESIPISFWCEQGSYNKQVRAKQITNVIFFIDRL